jgi:hypothetical protein
MAMPQQIRVFHRRLFQPGNVFLGDNQHVGGSLRVDIVKGKGVFVFVNFLGRHFAAHNAAKQASSHSVDSVVLKLGS